jgi:hypothetical protein
MKKKLALAFLFVFALAVVTPTIAAIVDNSTVISMIDDNKKDKKKQQKLAAIKKNQLRPQKRKNVPVLLRKKVAAKTKQLRPKQNHAINLVATKAKTRNNRNVHSLVKARNRDVPGFFILDSATCHKPLDCRTTHAGSFHRATPSNRCPLPVPSAPVSI